MWEVGDLLNQWEMLQGEAENLAGLTCKLITLL